jgi:hypothetical protein
MIHTLGCICITATLWTGAMVGNYCGEDWKVKVVMCCFRFWLVPTDDLLLGRTSPNHEVLFDDILSESSRSLWYMSLS